MFNIEGGCYAKAINLSPESEPEIFQALRFAAVLENVVLEDDRSVDFADTTITENTRGLSHSLHQERADPVHGRPPDGRDLPHLRCVRRTPPVSSRPARCITSSAATRRRSRAPKSAKEPSATFSPCFGGPFLVWHPSVRGAARGENEAAQARVWLINTGWSGGRTASASGSNSPTRAILDAIHGGALAAATSKRDPVFGFEVITACPGVPSGNPVAARHLG